MTPVQHISQQIRSAFFGSNWCGLSLQQELNDLPVEQAIRSQPHSHSIAELVFHIGYYFQGVGDVLRGGPLEIKDKFSFEMPAISTGMEWRSLLDRTWQTAEDFIQCVESLSEEQLSGTFVDEKYGDYYRNLTGIVEHLYYHLGQIVLLKKGMSTH
jgi:uncharacterized damage-inducible protein DinB